MTDTLNGLNRSDIKITDDSPETVLAATIADYEARTGKKLQPAHIERLLINTYAYRETLLRQQINEAYRQQHRNMRLNNSHALLLKRVARLQFVIAHQLQQQRIQRGKFFITARCAAQIVQKARDFGAIFILAIAVIQPRKNARHLQMPLHAHPFIPFIKDIKLRGHRQARRARLFPIANG